MKDSSDTWPGYKRFKKVPKYWKSNWLCSLPQSKFTPRLLSAVDHEDSEALCNMFYFVLQVHDDTIIPQEMQNKEVMSQVLFKRAADLGHRVNLVFNSGAVHETTGKVDMSKLSSYNIVFNGDGAEVVHCSGARAAFPASLNSKRGFKVKHALQDSRAELVDDEGVTVKFLQRWPTDTHPNNEIILKPHLHLQKLATEFVSSLDEAKTKHGSAVKEDEA
eukprot:1672387-Lingulodinium_polyedra.AAC.1